MSNGIGRGTTPYNRFNVAIDLRDANEVWLTYTQGSRIVIDKVKSDLTISEKMVELHLTQKETLSLKSNLPVSIQFRANIGGEAYRSNIIETTVEKILKEGVI